MARSLLRKVVLLGGIVVAAKVLLNRRSGADVADPSVDRID